MEGIIITTSDVTLLSLFLLLGSGIVQTAHSLHLNLTTNL